MAPRVDPSRLVFTRLGQSNPGGHAVSRTGPPNMSRHSTADFNALSNGRTRCASGGFGDHIRRSGAHRNYRASGALGQ